MLLARLVVLLAISAAKPSFSNAALISVDDSSPLIQYSLGDWIHHIDQPLNATLFNNTFTVAITGGAVASFPFNGSAIQYWADKNNYHGTVEVGLDGRNLGIFDLNASPKVLPAAIVNVTNLSTDPHVITVKVTTNHLSVDIDRFVYDDTPLPSPSTSVTPSGGGSANGLSTGDIVAISIGIPAGLGALATVMGVFIAWRRRT